MTTAFPTAIDAFINPSPTDKTNNLTTPHSDQHADANDAIEALETKVGTGASTPSAGTVLRGTGAGASAFGALVNADVSDSADIAMTKLQPHEFLAHRTSSASNVTGDGTAYTVPFNAEVYDVSSAYNTSTGVFTAPVTGRYHFEFLLTLNGLGAAHNIGYPELVTSNKTFRGTRGNLGAMRDSTNAMSVALSVTCDMDANDTAHVSVVAAGGTKVVAVAGDASIGETYFSGYQAG